MDIYHKIFLMVLLSCLILTGCKEASTNEPQEQYYPDYYPTSIGSTFKYLVTEKDSSGNLLQSGTRNILFSGTSLYNGINYTTQDDSLGFWKSKFCQYISCSKI